MKPAQVVTVGSLLLLLAGSLIVAWLARDAPLDPAWSRGLLRLDGLAALFGACVALLALAEALAEPGRSPRLALAAWLLAAALASTHLAALSALLVGVALLLGGRRPALLLPALLAGAGLVWLALQAGTWRYPAPAAGLGLNSLSLGLLLLAAVGAAGAWALPGARPAPPDPPVLLAAGCLYSLYRLFALGPWSLGWLYAALLLGAGAALWAAGRACLAPDDHAQGWLSVYLLALGLVGAGLSSGAGVALGAFALLALAPLRLGLAPAAAGPRPLRWLLAGAVPLTAPFTAAWAGVAASLAGGLSLLAAALWAAALVAALTIARLAGRAEQEEPGPASRPSPGASPLLPLAAGWSLAVGVGAPAVVALLVDPAVAQLQAGLTPFGELALWPWAGLIAYNAARQPVATLPSLALVVLMLVLGALAWAVARLAALRSPESREDAPD